MKTMTQNFEDFLISIEKEEKELNPLVVKSNWEVKSDIYNLPVLRIFPNFSLTNSGPSNGIKLILDLETFDNADQGTDYDALQVIIGDKENFPLFDLDGISIRPGEMATVKVVPVIHRITESAAAFDSEARRCILSESLEYNISGSGYDITEYSLTNCWLTAALQEMEARCSKNESLACKVGVLRQVGTWNKDRQRDIDCYPRCRR